MSNKILLIAAGAGFVVILVCAVLFGEAMQSHRASGDRVGVATAPQPTALVTPSAPPEKPDALDANLAMNSADPTLVQFVSSFQASAGASCKQSLTDAAKSKNVDFAAKATTVCDCATSGVMATITVGEARLAIESAVVGDTDTNPTMQALKSRFVDAGKACMSKATNPK
jgi:hypothetical protein